MEEEKESKPIFVPIAQRNLLGQLKTGQNNKEVATGTGSSIYYI